MWHSGSGGQRRSFPWGPLRATPLRWTAKLCCSWPKRTFDTGPLIQVRIIYRSCDWKEWKLQQKLKRVRGGNSHLCWGGLGKGGERKGRDTCMRQGQKGQRGKEILIHLSCRHIWMQIQTQTSNPFIVKTPCRAPRKQAAPAAFCDFRLFAVKAYLFTDPTTAAS